MKSWRTRAAAAALVAAAAVVPLTAGTASAAASPSASVSASIPWLGKLVPIAGTWSELSHCEWEKEEFSKQNTRYAALFCIRHDQGYYELWGLPF